MARPLRIEYPNAWYHVMNRGRRGENIFSDKKDYHLFLTVLQESSELFDLQVAAYGLMPNHYHLLLHTPSGNLSRAMRHVNGVYTQRYNRRWKTDGQLFRGRYKSILVEQDSYLLELLRYIYRNPVRANLCKTVADYSWSSHQGYLSDAGKWDWLFKHFLLGMFSDQPRRARKEYLKFVQDEDSMAVLKFFSKKNLASIFGSENFVQWVKTKYHALKKNREVPQSRQLAPTIAEIKKAVSLCFGVEEKVLSRTKRGQVNEPRNLAIFISRKRSGLKLDEIGKEFDLGSYSSVSSVVIRTEHLLSRNKELRKMMDTINSKLNKSQAKT
jgi:REP element-mobilizing transposase RayT